MRGEREEVRAERGHGQVLWDFVGRIWAFTIKEEGALRGCGQRRGLT